MVRRRKNIHGPVALPSRHWRSASALHAVYELNEHVLDVLARLAAGAAKNLKLEIVSRYRDLWARLDATARQRAARSPVLLLDVHFKNEEWWRGALSPGGARLRSVPSSESFPSRWAAELLRQTLMLAWTTARADARAAIMMFGMSPGVAHQMAGLTPPIIGSLASHHRYELCPRWARAFEFWQMLLLAAQTDRGEVLYEMSLYSLQLLAAS